MLRSGSASLLADATLNVLGQETDELDPRIRAGNDANAVDGMYQR